MSMEVNHAHFSQLINAYLEALDCSTCRHHVAEEDPEEDNHFRIHIEAGPDDRRLFVLVVS